MKKIKKYIYGFIVALTPLLAFSGSTDNFDSSNEILTADENLEGINTFNSDMKNFPENFDINNHIIKNHDFSGKCLKGVDLSYWEFINVNFEDTDLRETNFTGASFPWFIYKGIGYLYKDFKMNGALLAKEFRFDKTLSHLELVKLYSYFIVHGKKEKAKGLNIVLPHSQLNLKRKNLSNLNLKGINLQGANLCGAKLENTDLRDSNLMYVKMNNTILKGADLERANLEHSILEGTNFSETNLKGTSFAQAIIDNINLSYATLNNTKFSRAGLRNTNLTGVNRSKVIINDNSELLFIYSEPYVNPSTKLIKVMGYSLPIVFGINLLFR